MDLQSRELVGSISPHLGNLSFLRELLLQNNSFGNEIPPDIGREVPVELGSLSKLAIVNIEANNLRGSISPFTNLPSLRDLFLDRNYFDGSFPDGFDRLKNLQILALSVSRLSGVILASLFNHSSLTSFNVIVNQIQGSLPWDLGITLPNLELFGIAGNQFTGSIPVSILNASKFHEHELDQNNLTGKYLNVGLNNFGCKIPESISNLSSNLKLLSLDNNQIFGSIPPGIVNLVGLQSLYMQVNQLTGTIPSGIGKLQNLHELNLLNNSLSGNIPSSLGNLSLLSKLVLGLNNFLGNIPPSLGNCSNLQKLLLSQNNLNGSIPKQVVSISSLSIYLDLSQNQLSGYLPMEVAKLINLGYLDVSKNLLSGEIPSTLGSCTSLKTLRLGNNFFNGTIPSSLSFLRGLSELDLANNTLSGEIPVYLKSFILLQNLNLSFNNFEGIVPTQGVFSNASKISVVGNSKLSGGGFRAVYKAVIDGRIFAVKVLNLLRHGASKSFVSECEALRNIRHRNLVKLVIACSTVDYQGHDFKALIYEFLVNGSLEEWLHPNPNEDLSNEEIRKLNLFQRLNIVINIVCALNYLHNHGQTPTIHCDLKPSNILLDKDMAGHVEYGMGSEVPAYGDIYSFGILMLEMFTGKRPTDEIFKDGLSLHNFVKEALPGSVSEISGPILFQTEREEKENIIRSEKIVECLSLILEIGVNCSSNLPRERMEINDVASKLYFIKDTLLGFEIH
ncbi:receptor kinase-like protein Xa21 [Camellia sinensis]|uniref:receptor kinase-like protein Xa21 n=1 Tax=Camellia sinensis TaxID=4442 RepID=UPI001035ED41|nr:receptor kinase-like protein Xa21 [Camellia sinensis]